ncbi:MAG: 50S ribosomal protein L31e [Candidatus Nanoarchaeia archaeon]|jgi:large subunit ribosomal protein L31e
MVDDKKLKESKKEDSKVSLDRIYTIPLKRDVVKKPIYQRSNRAVRVIRAFIKKHMKGDKIIIDTKINELIWARGSKYPPSKVKVKAIKDGAGTVRVSLEA